MGRHAVTREPLHVVYVGNSADLGALRRLMEAHGAVTRTRLTPAVAIVVADPSVPADHPTLRAANTLGIPIMASREAVNQYAGWRTRSESGRPDLNGTRPDLNGTRPDLNGTRPETNGIRWTWPFRRRS